MPWEDRPSYVYEDGYVDLEEWTGQSTRHQPGFLRDPIIPVTDCNSVVAAVGDRSCDPRSGGTAGTKNLAAAFGIGVQQFRRNIRGQMDFLRYMGGIPVTNQNSLDAFTRAYKQRVRSARLERLEIPADCSGGSNLDPNALPKSNFNGAD